MILSVSQYMNAPQQYLFPESTYLIINKKTKRVFRGRFLFTNPAKTMAYFEDLTDTETNAPLQFQSEYQKWVDLQLFIISK